MSPKRSDVRVLSGRYELIEKIGTGGMAEVWSGRDRVLGRTVAVKTLLAQFSGDPQFIARFRREAQSAAALNHPNIVGVYDTGSDDGTHYIVMELLESRTLRDLVREEGPLLPERAAEIAAEVSGALAFAHARGIVHRDVKPANIMLTGNGGVKVTDFGIARAMSGESVTATATVLGTAQYFSPEQAQAAPVDARSDLYSLGVVLYEMVTRQVPFTGSSPVAVAYKHVKEDPIPPSRLNADVSGGVEAIILKSMAKNPANRYQSADEMREDLLRAVHGQPVTATPVLADATGVIPALADETVVISHRGARTAPVAMPRALDPVARRRRNGFVLLALIALAIVGVVLWGIVGLFGRKPLIAVPNVVGQTQTAAQQTLVDKGFQVRVLEAVPNNEFAKGIIFLQDPEAGEKLEKGQTVRITPSDGKKLVAVPDVVGKTEKQAKEILEKAGLLVGERSFETHLTIGEGRVIESNPARGNLIPSGSRVALVISSGQPTNEVPDVRGDTEEAARAKITGAGFEIQVFFEDIGPNCVADPGTVCRQDPDPNSQAEEGSTVKVWIAQEPQPTESPSPSPSGAPSI